MAIGPFMQAMVGRVPEGGVNPDWSGVHQPAPLAAPPNVDAALLRREARIAARRKAAELAAIEAAKRAPEVEAQRQAEQRHNFDGRQMAKASVYGNYLSAKQLANGINSIGSPVRVKEKPVNPFTVENSAYKDLSAPLVPLRSPANPWPGSIPVDGRFNYYGSGSENSRLRSPNMFDAYPSDGGSTYYGPGGERSRGGLILSDAPAFYEGSAAEFYGEESPFRVDTNAHPRGAFAEAAWATNNPQQALGRYQKKASEAMQRYGSSFNQAMQRR